MSPSQTVSSALRRAGIALLLTFLAYAMIWLLRFLYPRQFPLGNFFGFVFLWAVCYLIVYGLAWAKRTLLWSLRNQMSAAYILIAVVPVLLLLSMAGLAAYLLYWQIGSYVLYNQVQTRVARVANIAGALATALAIEGATTGHVATVLPVPSPTQGILDSARIDFPGLQIEIGGGQELMARTHSGEAAGFRGIVFSNGQLTLDAVSIRVAGGGKAMVLVSAPVTPQLLESLSPELGTIHFLVMRPVVGDSVPGEIAMLNGEKVLLADRISTNRPEPRAVNLFDKQINGIADLKVVDMDQAGPSGMQTELRASFFTRPSQLNRLLFGPFGESGSAAVTLLFVVAAVFLVLEIAALITGILLTRSMTAAVDHLYLATQHVQTGDLSFRVQVKQQDELGSLGQSFNSMVQSIGNLIEEQRERQRLANELAIAREVQTQLFPQEVPQIPGVELEAICRPARLVSGDYYDFIRIGPTRLAIALADISGKGISAALLMASLQAALRSELMRDGLGAEPVLPSTAEIVSHLNRHLFLNTSEERYATFFLAIYDAQTRRLSYTNAGHLPPLYIVGDRVRKLATDDTVIGLFGDAQFHEAAIDIGAESLLVIYSDGMTEPENARGELFGSDRLGEVAQRTQQSSPRAIAAAMLKSAEQWSGSAEQADDMTVVVARFHDPAKPAPTEGLTVTSSASEPASLTR
jgi:sigma-B regulation protein RsbU (phosphoserine phosphatase)